MTLLSIHMNHPFDVTPAAHGTQHSMIQPEMRYSKLFLWALPFMTGIHVLEI